MHETIEIFSATTPPAKHQTVNFQSQLCNKRQATLTSIEPGASRAIVSRAANDDNPNKFTSQFLINCSYEFFQVSIAINCLPSLIRLEELTLLQVNNTGNQE